MRYRDEKFYWTYQRGVKWLENFISPDSMTHWMIKKSQGFTNVGLLRISKSIRVYAYLILSSQASAKSRIIGNMVSALTALQAFLNNFENVIVAYNNKILISDGNFSLVKNDKVYTLELEVSTLKIIHKSSQPTANHKNVEQEPTNTHTVIHKEETVALVLALAGVFKIWYVFR